MLWHIGGGQRATFRGSLLLQSDFQALNSGLHTDTFICVFISLALKLISLTNSFTCMLLSSDINLYLLHVLVFPLYLCF